MASGTARRHFATQTFYVLLASSVLAQPPTASAASRWTRSYTASEFQSVLRRLFLLPVASNTVHVLDHNASPSCLRCHPLYHLATHAQEAEAPISNAEARSTTTTHAASSEDANRRMLVMEDANTHVLVAEESTKHAVRLARAVDSADSLHVTLSSNTTSAHAQDTATHNQSVAKSSSISREGSNNSQVLPSPERAALLATRSSISSLLGDSSLSDYFSSILGNFSSKIAASTSTTTPESLNINSTIVLPGSSNDNGVSSSASTIATDAPLSSTTAIDVTNTASSADVTDVPSSSSSSSSSPSSPSSPSPSSSSTSTTFPMSTPLSSSSSSSPSTMSATTTSETKSYTQPISPPSSTSPSSTTTTSIVGDYDYDEAHKGHLHLTKEEFEVKSVNCVAEDDMCILSFQIPLIKPRGKQNFSLDILKADAFTCENEPDAEDTACCRSLVPRINRYLFVSNRTIPELLDANHCKNVYCQKDNCDYIGCEIPERGNCEAPHPTTPRVSTVVTPSTAKPAGTTGDRGLLSGSIDTNSTAIIISCLLTFLAGIGAAVLLAWLWRRRRNGKGSGHDNRSTGTEAGIVGKGADDPCYEELTEHRQASYKGGKQNTAEVRPNSENEYSYIPEHVTITPTTSSAYNVPGDHIPSRKLPTARAQSGSGDHGRSAYSLARRPETESQGRPQYFELEPQPLYQTSVEPDGYLSPQPNDHKYFILDNDKAAAADACCEKRRPVPEDRPFHARQQPPKPSHPARTKDRPLPLPRFDARGTTAAATSASGDVGYYSPLAHSPLGDDGVYTALGAKVSDGPPDYLELLPDFSVQKPAK